jgi:hypothetical protein
MEDEGGERELYGLSVEEAAMSSRAWFEGR